MNPYYLQKNPKTPRRKQREQEREGCRTSLLPSLLSNGIFKFFPSFFFSLVSESLTIYSAKQKAFGVFGAVFVSQPLKRARSILDVGLVRDGSIEAGRNGNGPGAWQVTGGKREM